MKRINFIKKVLFIIGIIILLPIDNKVYPFLENQRPKLQLPHQPFSNAKKQLPMAGRENNKKEEIYAPNEVLIGLKEGVEAEKVLKEVNIKAGSLGRIYDIKPAVNKFRKEYSANKSYKMDKDSQGWFWFLGKKYRAIDSVPDEQVFVEAYNHMSSTEKALYRSYKIKLAGNISVEEAVRKLEANPNIRYAQPNYLNMLYMVPDDPYYSTEGSWGQEFDDLWGIKKISCENAWDISQGEGVVVAVIDTGVDYTHPDLKDNMWVNADGKYGYDFSDQDDDPSDYYGHGTHCAGTIAAVGNNSIGVIGVAPKAKIMSVKIFPNAYDNVCVQAIKYAADNGAKVLSNSWGPQSRRPSCPIMEEAIDYAYDEKGCVVVFAAGNDDDDAVYYSPANYSKTISVAATDHNDLKASFSNWGDVDIAAPGGGDTVPQEIYAPHRTILSLLSSVVDSAMTGSGQLIVGGNYLRQAGTSMACPHAAGVCALILSKLPVLLPEQVKYILKKGVDQLPVDSDNEKLNCGRVNAKKPFSVDISMFCFSKITEPTLDAVIQEKDSVDILGAAYGDLFSHYILEYKSSGSDEWITIAESNTAVEAPSLLGIWDIKNLSDGNYNLRLRVINTYAEEFVRNNSVSINNITVSIVEPESGTIRDLEYIDIKAIACGWRFSSYILDYKLSTTDEWITITPETTTLVIEPSIIGNWDVRGLNDGQYTLRLRVFYKDKMHEKTSIVNVKIDNLIISEPKSNNYLKTQSVIEIKGVACGWSFTNYTLEYSLEGTDDWFSAGLNYDGGIEKNIEDSLLGELDTSVIEQPGKFYLKLTVNYDSKEMASEIITFFYDATLMPGFPIDLPGDPWSSRTSPHISFITMPDDSGSLVASNGARTIYLIDAYGIRSEIPRTAEMNGGCHQEILGPLSTGDLNGDGTQEIVTTVYQVQMWDYDAEENYRYDKADAYQLEPHEDYIWWPDSLSPYRMGYSSPYRIIEWPWRLERRAIAGGWDDHSGRYAVIDDMDGDGETKEIITKHTSANRSDYTKNQTVFYLLKSDGTPAYGWPVETPVTDFGYYLSGWESWPAPAVANLDGGNEKEIITWDPVQGLVSYSMNGQVMPGWQFSDDLVFENNAVGDQDYRTYKISRFTVADVDKDGKYEIIVKDSNNWLWIFDNMGGVQQKIKLENTNFYNAEIPVVDIDKDGNLEIIVSCFRNIDIYRYEADAVNLVYSISTAPALLKSNMVIGDVDGDSQLEIIVYSDAKEIASFKLDGQKVMSKILKDNPSTIDLMLTDIDKNGKLELSAAYYKVFMWELEGLATPENMPWPLEGHDPQHTGRVDITVTAIEGDINGDGQVNSVDLQLCVNILLGTEDFIPGADVNGDGVVGAVDIQMLVNIILGA
ncbi:MAG: S8 family serine peptidase [Candidatus Omnitrophota bacterium]